MTKYLGIDFGTKRIGIAISDDEGCFAFPLKTIEVSNTIFDEIDALVKERGVEVLVLGDPGKDEGVQATREKVLDFKQKLEARGYQVELQSEMMTSLYTDQFFNKKPIANKRGGDHASRGSAQGKRDESAAAMILQRFLDTTQK